MPTYKLEPINTVQIPEFQAWTDQFGMMTDNNSGNVTGNGNLYTAHYVLGLVLKNLISKEEAERINQVYLNNFIDRGLLVRSPDSASNRESQDDMFGALSADALLNSESRVLSDKLRTYGANNYCWGVDPDPSTLSTNKKVFLALELIFYKVRWTWNNVNPNKFHVDSWLGRRMEFIATLQMAAKSNVNLFYWIYWAIDMLLLVYFPNKTDNSSYILRFHSAIACQGYGKLTGKICQMVRNAVKRDWGDMGILLGAYFNNPNHPIVSFLKDIY